MRTSGVLLLQVMKPERLIGTASAGVDDDGEPYVRIGLEPTEGAVWFCSQRVLRLRRELAIQLIAFLRILVVSAGRLDGVDARRSAARTSGVVPTIRSIGAFKDGILECNLEGVDAVKVLPEADGLCVLLMPAHAAADLSDALTHELSRIATWDPDQS